MTSQPSTAARKEDRSNKLARTGSAPEPRSRLSFSEFLASARTLWPLSTNRRVTVLPSTPVAPVINIFMITSQRSRATNAAAWGVGVGGGGGGGGVHYFPRAVLLATDATVVINSANVTGLTR